MNFFIFTLTYIILCVTSLLFYLEVLLIHLGMREVIFFMTIFSDAMVGKQVNKKFLFIGVLELSVNAVADYSV